MESVYRLFTLRPQMGWSQLSLPKQQALLHEIRLCWQNLGGQLITEEPPTEYSTDIAYIAFGIATDLDMTALCQFISFLDERDWGRFIQCELPAFLSNHLTVDLYQN